MSPTRRAYLGQAGTLGGALTGVGLAGCTQPGRGTPPQTTVRVGSKAFPEQEILGYLAYYRLQTVNGIQVVDEIGSGNTRDNWNAVVSGTKDLYWEYTGTAWRELPPRHEERVTDRQRLYELVEADAREQGVRMAPPASFSNGYVLAADQGWSERTDVRTISELATHVEDGATDFGVAFGEDFYHRGDAWNGLADYYGIDDEARAALESGTFFVTSVGIPYELVRDGRAQVASGFETDPQLARSSLVQLDDDRDYFIPYQPAPTAHAPTVEEHPDIFDTLQPVVAALDGPTIRRLNRQVLVEERNPGVVARSFQTRIGEDG